MSQFKFIKESLPSIKGENVYIVLYNYSDYDYSIVKIMEKLDEAYEYICLQEGHIANKFQMITLENMNDIKDKIKDDYLNICYIKTGEYNKFNLCDYYEVSSYAIIPMKIC